MVKFWPLLAIFAAVAVFFYPVFLRGHVPLPGDFIVGVYYPWLDYKWGFAVGVPVKNPILTDVVSFTYPMQTLAVKLLREGTWPLWNPYILAGTPLFANFQSAPASPTNFVYFLFDTLSAWSFQIMLQHFLATVFTFLLLRHWKLSAFASLLGGIVFAFGGFNLLWSQWNGHALAAAFIPLTLFFEDRWLSGGRIKDGIGLSLAVGAQILSGYPQVVFYTLVAMGLLLVFRLVKSREFLVKTLLLGVFLLLALGLTAFQILPGFELLSLSQREVEGHPFEWAFLPFSKTITFFAPDYFGNHATGNYWGPQDYTSNTGFVAVTAFVLATLAVISARARKETRFLLGLLVFSLLLSYPTPISIFIWKSGIFGLQAASAHRALVLFNLSIALLAAFGTDHFLSGRRASWKALIFPFLVIGGFGLVTLYLYWSTRTSPDLFFDRGIPKYVVGLRNLVLPTASLLALTLTFWLANKFSKTRRVLTALLFLILSFELFRFGWKFTPFVKRDLVYPQTPVLEFLANQEKPSRVTGSKVIPINLRMPYGLESLEGYDAVYPLRISKFLSAINSGNTSGAPLGRYGTVDNETSRLLDLVNTKYYLTINPIPDQFDKERFNIVFEDKSVSVLESKTALTRAFMVYDWEVLDKETDILDRLLDPDFALKDKIILEEEVGIKPQEGAGSSKVEYKKYKEQESVIGVSTEKDGLLFVSDSWFPGWKAFVDGKETKIYRADFAFRAIAIEQGEHEVRFVYDPKSFSNGLLVSAFSLISLFALGGLARYTKLVR